MLRKFFAAWLVVLVIVPFTAPFSTCDLTGLFGGAGGQHTPVTPARSTALRTDAAVPTAVFVSAGGRVRLLPLSKAAAAESATPSSAASWIWSAASAGYIKQPTVLSTILRV